MSDKKGLPAPLRNAILLMVFAMLGLLGIVIILVLPQPQEAFPVIPSPTLPTGTPIYITATPEPTIVPTSTDIPTRIADTPTATATAYLFPTPYPLAINPDTGESIEMTWGDYPGPTIWPSLPIPEPMGIIPQPEGQVNVVLLGNDWRNPKSGTRTDTIILLTLNPNQGTASVMSFPRDLFVYVPGLTMLKFNTVWARGGYDVLFDTFEYNFGARPDYYVNINRNTFVDAINALGGIYVDVPRSLSDPSFAGGKYAVSAGRVYMDGAKARWYVSSRYTTSDFDRLERQQAVLKAIFLRLLTIDGINRIDELYRRFSRMVYTNISVNDLLPLVHLASQLSDTSRVSRYSIQEASVTRHILPNSGAYVLVADQMELFNVMVQALTP